MQKGKSGFEDVLELFNRLEHEVDLVVSARRVSRAARQAADIIAWLRAQRPDTIVHVGSVAALVLVGLTLGLARRQPPKRIGSAVPGRPKRKADKRRPAARRGNRRRGRKVT